MEIIQAFAAYFVGILVISAVVQVLFSYSLQVISEKNELPEFAAFISWIPLLQMYPYIKVGGGDFKRFALVGIGGTIGLVVVAGIAGAALGEMGGLVAGLLVGVFGIAAMVYFARIAMATAERRGLPKWIGLLSFVPVVNIAIYPYIAFHDGFRAPNKLGVVLGLLLAFGPLPGQVAMVNMLSEQAQEVAQADLGDGVTMEQAIAGLGTAMEIGMQLAMLDEIDPSDPDQARMMSDSIAELHAKIDANRAALGEDSAMEMESVLAKHQMRLENPGMPLDELAMDEPEMAMDPGPGAAMQQDMAARRAPDVYQPPTLSAGPPLTAEIPRNGDQGFALPLSPDCPAGTQSQGSSPPYGLREWCEKVGADAGIKHGWMAEYWDNGNPKIAGEYRDGLRVGVWSRFYDDGSKRVQAEFRDGLQEGILLSWNPDGSLAYEKHFSQGAPASR